MARMTNAQLLERLSHLEAENALLRASAQDSTAQAPPSPAPLARRNGGWRAVLAVVLIVVGTLLAPISVVAVWTSATLTDTERFVATYAPLADDPAVQAYVGAQVVASIDDQLDIDQLTSDVIDGVIELGTGPAATRALELLKGPAAAGTRSLVEGVVARFVSSDAFSDVWASALRVSHTQLVAAMSASDDAAIVLAADGTIGVQLGPIIAAARTALLDQGIAIAEVIPDIDRTIVVAQSDALPTVRLGYAAAVAAGAWLPWVALAFLVAGVLVARRRTRALVAAGAALALAMLTTVAGVAVGGVVFSTSVAPSVIPSDVGSLLYDTVTRGMRDTAIAVFVLAVVVAVVAWAAGPFAVPRRARGAVESVAVRARGFADARGLSSGRVGAWLDAQRVLARVVIAVVAAAVVLFVRPLSPALILWTLAIALVALLVLELVRRPPTAARAEVEVGEESAREDDAPDSSVLDDAAGPEQPAREDPVSAGR